MSVARAAYWAALIRDWEDGDLSQAEFCRVRGINLGTFRSWLYHPRHREAVSAEAKSPSNACPPTFAPVHVIPSAENSSSIDERRLSAIEIRLENGRRIAIAPGFDAETLRRLMEVLEDDRC